MNKMDKVKKSCETAKKVVGVLRGIVIAALILCVVGAVICFALNSKIDQSIIANSDNVTLDSNLSIMGIETNLDAEELVEKGLYGVYAGACCLLGAMACLFIVLVFNSINKILVEIIDEGTPFSEEVVKRLKVSFIFMVIMVTFSMGLGYGLFIGMFFWCIYNIFQYGCELQNQADETL